MTGKPTLYVETTIPSYLAARPSRDVITLARQQLTQDWWANHRQAYNLYVSQFVVEEAARGDQDTAQSRLLLIGSLPRLDITPAVAELAAELVAVLNLPEKAAADSQHIAVALYHGMDYLLTWNYAHLGNTLTRKLLARFAGRSGLSVPTICTPEELRPEGS